jgi:uncharacterized protein
MSQRAENEAFVRSFFTTLAEGNFDRIMELFHEDATWTVCATGIAGAGSHHGRADIVAFLAPVRDLFEPGNPVVEIANLVAGDSWVAVEGVGSGRFKDGRPYANQYAFFIEVDDSKIRSLREYMDSYYVSTL